MKLNSNDFWNVVDSLNWGQNPDYKTVGVLFQKLNPSDRKKFINRYQIFYNKLYNKVTDFITKNSTTRNRFPFSGDDSFGDMIDHSIGLGHDFYHSALKDPMVLTQIKPVESFRYCFHFESKKVATFPLDEFISMAKIKILLKIDKPL